MEIDRKKPNLEYTKENCVRCCYWCNSAKTDEFDDVEFESIGDASKKIGMTGLTVNRHALPDWYPCKSVGFLNPY